MDDRIREAEEELEELIKRRDDADLNGSAKDYLDLARAVRRKQRDIREAKKHLKNARRKPSEDDPEDLEGLEETIQWALREVRKG